MRSFTVDEVAVLSASLLKGPDLMDDAAGVEADNEGCT